MVLFTITFLLGIPYTPTLLKPKAKRKSKGDILNGEKNYTEIEVVKPTFTCRIEYVLYPNHVKFANVICWGDVATISTDESSSSVGLLIIEKLSWIHFRMQHDIDIDISLFCDHKITFSITPQPKQAQIKGRTLYGPKTRKFIFETIYESPEKIEASDVRSLSITAESGPHLQSVQEIITDLTREYHINDVKREGSKEFYITGGSFLSGLNDFKNCTNYSEEIPYFCTITRARGLMTKAEAERYNPLSITINKLDNLPCADMELSGISRVKLRYVIYGESTETTAMKLSKRIVINHTKTILTNNLEIFSLVELLQTKGLEIEIIGEGNFKLAMNEIKLGVAVIDLSSLLYKPHRIIAKYNFKPPEENFDPKNDAIMNANEINMYRRFCQYLITSTIKVSVRLASMLKIPPKPPHLMNRLFIILYDVGLAVEILNVIFNEFPLMIDHSRSGTRIKRSISNNYNKKVSHVENNKSGFVIDCVDKILIYIESNLLEQVWESVLMTDPAKGRILFDSSLVFLNRLYKDFLPYGGFYFITLREELEVIVSKPKTHIEDSVPFLAKKALISLHRLNYCLSMKTACRDNLFPSPQSLYSLNIEFGVPLTLQNKLEERSQSIPF